MRQSAPDIVPHPSLHQSQQLLCKGTGSSDCLSASEAKAAAEIYTGLRNSRTGSQLYPGLAPGSELGWAMIGTFRNPGVEHFRYLTFKNPNWNYGAFDAARDVARADQVDHNTINAT